jgi:hypothetical protein
MISSSLSVSISSTTISTLLVAVRSVGFSGSRSPSAAALSELHSVFPLIPAFGCRVSVGCAAGVDSAVRSAFSSSPSLLVFSATSSRFAFAGSVAALALRSSACVRSVARGSRGLFLPAHSVAKVPAPGVPLLLLLV